jgi:hypothetical protein
MIRFKYFSVYLCVSSVKLSAIIYMHYTENHGERTEIHRVFSLRHSETSLCTSVPQFNFIIQRTTENAQRFTENFLCVPLRLLCAALFNKLISLHREPRRTHRDSQSIFSELLCDFSVQLCATSWMYYIENNRG